MGGASARRWALRRALEEATGPTLAIESGRPHLAPGSCALSALPPGRGWRPHRSVLSLIWAYFLLNWLLQNWLGGVAF